MQKVFVLDAEKRPLAPCRPATARRLLSGGRVAVFRRFPFTFILNRPVGEPGPQPLRLKLDPGSKTTGLAVVKDATGEVVFAAEIEHRGEAVRAALLKRRGKTIKRKHP